MKSTKLRDILVEAADIAGNIQKESLKENIAGIDSKYGGSDTLDIVTETDIKTEEALRDFFSRTLPDYNIIGEELGGSYNGNGKLILIDPLDCTKSYRDRLPNFGPIIGIYRQRRNVAGIEYNVMGGIKYVATEHTGFERFGPKEEIPKDAIYIESKVSGSDSLAHRLAESVREEFPDNHIVINSQNVLNKVRVFDGNWKVFFHAGLARHDISAVPIFSRLTGARATDHNGVPYQLLDPELEIEKYKTGKSEHIYSNPILISQPEYHDRFLRVLHRFRKELDAIQEC